ncbi:MAG: hypothetical protein ACTSPA_15710 [Promethearchaeota archaeon]
MSFENYLNHMDWADRSGMMDWNFDSMGYSNIFGAIFIFTLITVFLILSRRLFHSVNDEKTSPESNIPEVSTQNIQYEKAIDKSVFYCIHCGTQLNNSEMKFCPECGAHIS